MSWRCRFGFHRLVEDWGANHAYMEEHGLDILGWPSGSILHRCERCGRVMWG